MGAHEDWLDEVFRVTPDDQDRQWVERELGDVPRRLTPFAQGQAIVRAGFERGYAGGVPVESLGRDQ